MIVTDASVIIKILLANQESVPLRKTLFASGAPLHAPHLLDIEVVQTFRRLCRVGDMSAERGFQALDHFRILPLRRYPHLFLVDRVWQLRHNVTAYDAVYLALAEALQATLYTSDSGLAAIARQTVAVQLV